MSVSCPKISMNFLCPWNKVQIFWLSFTELTSSQHGFTSQLPLQENSFVVRLTIFLTHPFNQSSLPMSTYTPQMPHLSAPCPSYSVPSNLPTCLRLKSSLIKYVTSPSLSQHIVISSILNFCKHFRIVTILVLFFN